MSSPKVSVIIPTYNRRGYLGFAIQSVLDQTFSDFELIVVDDGSTDGTEDLVRQFSDPRIRYRRQEHRGISAAMNAGIRAARGELVARLDSDDVWFPEMLACQSSLLDARPEVGAVYAKATGMDAEGNPLPTTWGFPPRYPDSTLRSMLYEDMTCNITVVARRSCLERVGGFDESLRTSEDWDLWLRVSRHFEFAFLDLVVARFRLHSDSITACNAPGGDEERERRILVLDKFFALPGLPADALAMKRIAYRNVYTRNGLLWLTERKYRRAATAFVQAVRVSPARSAALGRVLWFVLKWRLLSRSAFGRSLADTAAWLQGSALIRNPPVERS